MATRRTGSSAAPQSMWYTTTLEEILPFNNDSHILEDKEDRVSVKWAIEAAALDAIIKIANASAKREHKSGGNFGKLEINTSNATPSKFIKAAYEDHDWTVIVPSTLYPRFFEKREDGQRNGGQLAQAMDKWLETDPAEEPNGGYANFHQHLDNYIAKKIEKGEEVDLEAALADFPDYDSDKDDANDRWIPWLEWWQKKGAKDTEPTDEDAPWSHKYWWNEKDEGSDLTNALLLKN
ncbi:hypothetical protein F5Y05DRAFT_411160 [Hypoxylon sp. FL0543]|nr:hypothetical protein F5Y05DRAFT_411160 [Hypoxylon sp. FL0543]